MTTLVEVQYLQDRNSEPRTIGRARFPAVPQPGENILVGERAFQVIGRGFSVPSLATLPPSAELVTPEVEVGILVVQIGGPPMLVATASPLKI